MAELVYDAIQEPQDAVGRAISAGAKAIEAAECGLDETMSAFIVWGAKCADVVERANRSRSTGSPLEVWLRPPNQNTPERL